MSVAPQPVVAPVSTPAPASTEVIVDRPLNRVNTVIGIISAIAVLIVALAGGYAGQQVLNSKSTQTEARVSKLEDAFQAKAEEDARFQGRTDASLEAIKAAMGIQRDEMKERSPIRPAYAPPAH